MNLPEQPKLIGVAHLNEKGQVVIPKEAREFLGIGKGDRVLIMASPVFKSILIARPEDIEAQLQSMMASTEKTIGAVRQNMRPKSDAG